MRKRTPRVLILLFSLSALTMIFITKCGIVIDNISLEHQPQTRHTRELFQAAIEETEKRHQSQTEELQKRIQELEETLMKVRQQQKNASKTSTTNKSQNATSNIEKYLQAKLQSAEIFHGLERRNEYELTSFNRFTLNRIYLVDPGLGKRVVEKPVGSKKKDLLEVISFSLDNLNQNRKNSSTFFTLSDFIEGIYRTDLASGTHYELYFRTPRSLKSAKYSKVVVLRPFGPLLTAIKALVKTEETWINLILPLKGRLESFDMFMKNFIEVCILQDKRIYLTIVYFGTEGFDFVRNLTKTTKKNHNYKYIKIINVSGDFSRGEGFKIGMQSWRGGDVVMFMCDVDIVFNADFLERCRLNTEKHKKVYYPIVFSLYNPTVVYSLQDKIIPPLRDRLIISKHTGFWRDFGYGMTCQYKSDFENVKGFDEEITGWGGEDVSLYKKYVQSDIMVIRATDPGIFHLWHDKMCDPNLSHDQYQGCIRSKSLSEASHAQLGLLAFKDEIDLHKLQKGTTTDKKST